jgi:hypothetical protein
MRSADRELLISLFGDIGHPLASRCATKMVVSPRFRAFLVQYRGKISRKVRSLDRAESWRDLWLELWMAARLLSDRRFELVYESYSAQKMRGPDLTAVFRTHVTCHIEIKHVRAELSSAKWAEIVCSKLGQFPPGAFNVLLVGTAMPTEQCCMAETAIPELSRLAQSREDVLFQRYGLLGARDFARHLVRLSGVLQVTDWDPAGAGRLYLWTNPSARNVLPTDLARAFLA